jgi:hypothetical protein
MLKCDDLFQVWTELFNIIDTSFGIKGLIRRVSFTRFIAALNSPTTAETFKESVKKQNKVSNNIFHDVSNALLELPN